MSGVRARGTRTHNEITCLDLLNVWTETYSYLLILLQCIGFKYIVCILDSISSSILCFRFFHNNTMEHLSKVRTASDGNDW